MSMNYKTGLQGRGSLQSQPTSQPQSATKLSKADPAKNANKDLKNMASNLKQITKLNQTDKSPRLQARSPTNLTQMNVAGKVSRPFTPQSPLMSTPLATNSANSKNTALNKAITPKTNHAAAGSFSAMSQSPNTKGFRLGTEADTTPKRYGSNRVQTEVDLGRYKNFTPEPGYFDSLKLFTDEDDEVEDLLGTAMKKSPEVNLYSRQKTEGKATNNSKSIAVTGTGLASKTTKPTHQSTQSTYERPPSSFGKQASLQNNKTPTKSEVKTITKTKSMALQKTPIKSEKIKVSEKSKNVNDSESKSPLNTTGINEVTKESGSQSESKSEIGSHTMMMDNFRMSSATPQPGLHGYGIISLGLKDQVSELMKEKDQDKKTIKMLQDQIGNLQKFLEEYQARNEQDQSQQEQQEQQTPTLPSDGQKSLASSFVSDLKQKEVNLLKMQNDTLTITLDIVRNENIILKKAQKQNMQFKEAAKRYRDLVKVKTEECNKLEAEVVTLKKELGNYMSIHITSDTSPYQKSEGGSTKNKQLYDKDARKSVWSSLSIPNGEYGAEVDDSVAPYPQEFTVRPMPEEV